MDSLEKFIKENRESLDRYEPSPHVWDRITGQRVIINRNLLVRMSAAGSNYRDSGKCNLYLYFCKQKKQTC